MQQATARWAIPRPGEVIGGKYLVESERGRSALGVVLAATHQKLNRRVAIKLMRPEWSGRKEALDRLLREGYAPRRIHSEHAVRVFEVDRLESGAPYVVFERLDGDDLGHLVQAHGPLPVPVAVDWALQAADALAEAHARGIVHRDVKPSNLVLTTDVRGACCIKVVDFGSAKVAGMDSAGSALAAQVRIRSSEYMAPEQLRTGDTDPRVDVWALGAVLHYLLAGEAPFRARSVSELIAAILAEHPARISSLRNDVPAYLERAILRCLEKNRDLRFRSMAEVARALMPVTSAAEARPFVAAPASDPVETQADSPGWDIPFFEEPLSASSDSVVPGGAEHHRRGRARPSGLAATSSVVLPSLLALGVLGGLVFSGAYHVVHQHDDERLAELRAATAPVRAQPPAAPSAAAPPVSPPASARPEPFASGSAPRSVAPTKTVRRAPRATLPSRSRRPTPSASSRPSLALPSVEEPAREPDDNPYSETEGEK